MRRLENKIALVTGGGAGIGRAIAETFARHGAHVIIADRDGHVAETVAQGIKKGNGAAMAHLVDITDTLQVTQLMERIGETFGRLDVLVNNAGVGLGQGIEFHELGDEVWHDLWRVNVDGTVRCAREAFKLLKASGQASVINLSSVMASKHTEKTSAYSASKGAISALSRRLAVEYAPHGIRVNCLCPGYVKTALTSQVGANPMLVKFLISRTPLRRFGTPQDIANAALFLASDEAAYVTGAGLSVDGGMSVTL
jgi:NAD(P)-dependent dehydrogenase (short-subunit alcohol dehydrogenase family)